MTRADATPPAPRALQRAVPRTVVGASGLLAAFNRAGVLEPVDVHAGEAIARLAEERDEAVRLAAALAVRAPRLGHVCADLAGVRDTVVVDDPDQAAQVAALPWPEPTAWLAAVAASPLVDGDPAGDGRPGGADAGDAPADGGWPDERPLRLVGDRLYLDRYWRYEQRVVAQLRERAARPADGVAPELLAAGLDRLFGRHADHPDWQRLAAATAVLRRLAVVAGGPGTGKTTTVARVLALLHEQAAAGGQRPPRVALAAPTGKAANRLQEAITEACGPAATPPLHADEPVRAWLAGLDAATLHRLLGSHWGRRSRFRHHARNPLPHDVVVVDETSMVPLSLMAKLLDAVRADARVVLLGDPEQLASVEAGAVLGDVVGPATGGLRMRPAARQALEAVTPGAVPADAAPEGVAVGDGIVVLHRVHRFGGHIAALADAVQAGDADAVVSALAAGDDVAWIDRGVPVTEADDLDDVRAASVAAGDRLVAAARRGDAAAALAALESRRLLCAHRRGRFGADRWGGQVEAWLAEAVDGFEPGELWHVGRPVVVTANDYRLGVFNGDTGVVVRDPGGRLAVAFPAAAGPRLIAPGRLEAVETVHAMTVHKGQGSQFADVVVVLPEPESPLLTRELLYTALTRARTTLTVIGSADSVRRAVDQPIQRASGLGPALWGPLGHRAPTARR